MKFAVLCNSLMGLPSLQYLAQNGSLAAIGIPSMEHEATATLRELAPYLSVPLTVFDKISFKETAAGWFKDSGADCLLVYTFPYLLNQEMLSLPACGCLNFHFGLLPQYRGGDAIFWEIRNREAFGAVTVHRMEATLDTGPILIQQKVPIQPSDTYGAHMANLGMVGAQCTHELLALLARGPDQLEWKPQDESIARTWPKPGQHEVLIDWNTMSADEIVALVKACNPWNKGAYTLLNHQALRITVAQAGTTGNEGLPPGTVMDSAASGMRVSCMNDQSLLVDVIYLETGFYSGREISNLGITAGMRFASPTR